MIRFACLRFAPARNSKGVETKRELNSERSLCRWNGYPSFRRTIAVPPESAIAGFELLHSLGGGPFTQVFAARRRSDHSPCAIKIPRETWSADADAIRLLQRESVALQSVVHPHVVRLLESHVLARPRFLALERLTGESLRERLQRDDPLPFRMALWIARQIAEGLQAIHHAGYVHGDVKPENVQVESSGRAILLDLGFAQRPNQVGSLEAEGYLLGTLNYIAPERASLLHPDEFAADWFSFGVMLHEMLTGELPHEPRTTSEFLSRAIPASRVGGLSGMPNRLLDLLTALLHPSPPARPRGPNVIHELIALEIAALGQRQAG